MTLLTRLTLPQAIYCATPCGHFQCVRARGSSPYEGHEIRGEFKLDPLAAVLSAWIGCDGPRKGTQSEVNWTWTLWGFTRELLMDTNQCLVCSRCWSGDHSQAPIDQRRWQARDTVQTLQRPCLGLSQQLKACSSYRDLEWMDVPWELFYGVPPFVCWLSPLIWVQCPREIRCSCWPVLWTRFLGVVVCGSRRFSDHSWSLILVVVMRLPWLWLLYFVWLGSTFVMFWCFWVLVLCVCVRSFCCQVYDACCMCVKLMSTHPMKGRLDFLFFLNECTMRLWNGCAMRLWNEMGRCI